MFTQVYLGPEITIEVTGQRAMALLSRGSLILNTSIVVEPSTLGGFPGGGGVARDSARREVLLSPPSVPPAFPLGSLINGSLADMDVPSYNTNGLGAASYRYYLFTVSTSADDVDEVQRVSAGRRQTRKKKVGGGGRDEGRRGRSSGRCVFCAFAGIHSVWLIWASDANLFGRGALTFCC